MLGALFPASIDGRTNDQWHVDLSPKHVGPVGCLVHDGINRKQHEVHPRMENNGAHSHQGRPDRRCRRRILRNWGVNNTVPAEFLFYVLEACPGIPGAPNTLPDDEDAGIAREQLCEAFAHGLRIRECSHVSSTPPDGKHV